MFDLQILNTQYLQRNSRFLLVVRLGDLIANFRIEPPHEKKQQQKTTTTQWHVSPVKTQISLGGCPVWSESSLCTHCVAKGRIQATSMRQRKLWSDWEDAHVDLSFRWALSYFFLYQTATVMAPHSKKIWVTFWLPLPTGLPLSPT